MAWVTLEDLGGTIELVVFPRAWSKYQFTLEVGGVILAEGKVDARSNPSKVLVDNIRTEIKLTEPASNQEPAQMTLQPQHGASERNPAGPARKQVSERPSRVPEVVPDFDFEDGPPPPEDPPDWEKDPADRAQFAVQDLVMHAPDLPEEEPEPPAPVKTSPAASPMIEKAPPVVPPAVIMTPKIPTASLPPRLEDDHPPQMVTVILRPSGDPQRDIRRISRLHGTFISYPGKDRFALQIFEEGRGHLIEFPNDTTHLCDELITRLKEKVGEENLRIEPITYM
jgi:DNA polymerase-3 subunit alpha